MTKLNLVYRPPPDKWVNSRGLGQRQSLILCCPRNVDSVPIRKSDSASEPIHSVAPEIDRVGAERLLRRGHHRDWDFATPVVRCRERILFSTERSVLKVKVVIFDSLNEFFLERWPPKCIENRSQTFRNG